MAREVVLPFLEQRRYLHGTTLFDLLTREIPQESSISFKIAGIILTDRIRVETHEAAGSGGASATLQWRGSSGQGAIAVYAEPPSASPARTAYDETRVTRAATVDDTHAVFAGPASYTFIATLVPLFKELLARREKSEDPGQWMFTRLDLDRLPGSEFLPLRIELDRASNRVMARCAVVGGQRCKGQLYFSWVRP